MKTKKFYNHIIFRVLVSGYLGGLLGYTLGWYGLLISIPLAILLGATADS